MICKRTKSRLFSPTRMDEVAQFVSHHYEGRVRVVPLALRRVFEAEENRGRPSERRSPARAATDPDVNHKRHGEVQAERVSASIHRDWDCAPNARSDPSHERESLTETWKDAATRDGSPIDALAAVVGDLFLIELGPWTQVVQSP